MLGSFYANIYPFCLGIAEAQKNGRRFLWIPYKSGVGRLIRKKAPGPKPELINFYWIPSVPSFKEATLRTIKKMSYILGKKVKMTQIWKDGKVVPVTVVHAEPNKVSLLRTAERDGYEAVQLQLGKKKREFKNRPNQKVDVAALKLEDAIGVDSFAEGDKVRVSGITKGKGFAGVVKRYDFRGGPKTHGQKNRHCASRFHRLDRFPARRSGPPHGGTHGRGAHHHQELGGRGDR